MAISLGDAALAFAGGAAKQFNKNEDDRKKREADRQERVNQLLDQAAMKQSETEYSQQVLDHHKKSSLQESIKAHGGAGTVLGQKAIADYFGDDFATVVRSGQLGYLKAPEVGESPIPLSDRVLALRGSDYTPEVKKYAERVRGTTVGKLYDADGKAIARGVAVNENGKVDPAEYVAAGGVGMNESAAWFQDITDMSDDERMELGLAVLGEGDKELSYDKDRGMWMAIDPKTLKATAIKPSGIEDAVKELPDKDTLDALQQRESHYQQLVDSGVDVSTNQRRLNETQGLIQQKINENVDPETLRLREGNKRLYGELIQREGMLNTTLASLDRYANLSTESSGGVAGLITGFKDFVGTQVRGVTDMMGATQNMSVADKEKALADAGVTTDKLMDVDSAIYKGMNEAERTNMLYTVASVFREMGRRDISNADVERAQALLSQVGEGSSKRVGVVKTIRAQIHRRMREVNLQIFEMPGAAPEDRRRAGIAWLKTEREINGEMRGLVENKDYVVIGNEIGIRANDEDDSIIPLNEFLIRYPEARRL